MLFQCLDFRVRASHFSSPDFPNKRSNSDDLPETLTEDEHFKAGSPLELSFWLFPTFLYHVKEESQTNLLMKTA